MNKKSLIMILGSKTEGNKTSRTLDRTYRPPQPQQSNNKTVSMKTVRSNNVHH